MIYDDGAWWLVLVVLSPSLVDSCRQTRHSPLDTRFRQVPHHHHHGWQSGSAAHRRTVMAPVGNGNGVAAVMVIAGGDVDGDGDGDDDGDGDAGDSELRM